MYLKHICGKADSYMLLSALKLQIKMILQKIDVLSIMNPAPFYFHPALSGSLEKTYLIFTCTSDPTMNENNRKLIEQ